MTKHCVLGTPGFFDSDHLGARVIQVPDSEWVRPMVEVDGQQVPDSSALPPVIEVENPACRLPIGAQPVSNELVLSLHEAEVAGMVINWDVFPPRAEQAAPPSLDQLKAAKSQELNAATAKAIVGGFKSSALGEEYTYPSQSTDQANLNVSVTASILKADQPGWTTKFWCADQAGNWAWTDHTGPQIQQVGEDGMAAVMSWQGKNALLQAEVVAAATADQLAAIAW